VISYAILSEREGALFVARDQGLFRKQGLDVDLVYVASAPVALASIAHGDSQINTGSTSGAILGAMAGGLDLAFIAGLVNKLTGTIVTAPISESPLISKTKPLALPASAAAIGYLRCSRWNIGVSIPSATTSASV
jgi:hypothetical protein